MHPQPPSRKYHYDHMARSCVEVEFSGCFGTDNLFDEEEECLKFCSGPINFEANEVASNDTNEKEMEGKTIINFATAMPDLMESYILILLLNVLFNKSF